MITVNKAINRGLIIVNLPIPFIIIGVIGFGFYLEIKKILPANFFPFIIIMGLISAWFYWSIAITRWRIWSFSNVDNVHDLKKQAVEVKLIWPDGSFFERTEIRTKRQRELINELEKRFKEPKKRKIFVDDLTIPKETKIYYSKQSLVFSLLLMIGCIALGVFLITHRESLVIGIILFLIGIYFVIKDFNKITSFEPQIIIDEKGIKFKNDLYSWREITNETTTFEIIGKSIYSYLIFETNNGTIKLDIIDFNINFRELRHKLYIYRGRFEKTTANTWSASMRVAKG